MYNSSPFVILENQQTNVNVLRTGINKMRVIHSPLLSVTAKNAKALIKKSVLALIANIGTECKILATPSL